MNVLKQEKKLAVVKGLVEGCSIRSVERLTGVHRDTILRLLVDVGEKCSEVLDAQLKGFHSKLIQVDEIWTYCGKHGESVGAIRAYFKLGQRPQVSPLDLGHNRPLPCTGLRSVPGPSCAETRQIIWLSSTLRWSLSPARAFHLEVRSPLLRLQPSSPPK